MQAWEVVYRAFGFFDRKSTASADGPKRKCERKIRNGGILALVAAALTAAASVAGIVVESSDRATAQFLDPAGLIDALLLLILGVFVLRKSRIASTLLVVYFASNLVFVLRHRRPDAELRYRRVVWVAVRERDAGHL